jgi:arylsulfatase
VDEKYAAPYKKHGGVANFFGMIANIDENMGKLEQFLAETGLRDNTIVIFMTDNGGTAGVKIFNAGMRGRKQMYYDGGHRVPCFIRWPNGKLRRPGDVATPAQMQDILPTLIELCGVKKPASARFDGVSLAPLLRGAGGIADRMMVVQYGQILKKWDACTIWGRWRLVGQDELYDLREDPGQEKNLASQNPEVLAKMRAYYEAWWEKNVSVLDDYQAISLGAPQENPVHLTSSDWQDVYADNPTHVSNAVGGPRGGPWNVFIERDGEYQISLSRWPPEHNLPLAAGRPVQKMAVGELPEGKAMPIGGATLTIAGQSASTKTKPEDKAALFKVRLKGGVRTRLHAWFLDSAGNDLCGAFYAVVTRL